MKKIVLCILILVVIFLIISKIYKKISPLPQNNQVEKNEILKKEITFSLGLDGIITMHRSILNLSPLFFVIKIENLREKKYILGFLDNQFELID